MIVCICRGKSERDIEKAIERGASSLRDLQRCGVGDQCGSCHNALRMMLTAAAEPCPACAAAEPAAAVAMA